MLIPLGTDRPLKRPTRIVLALIALNMVIFLLTLLASMSAEGKEQTQRIYSELVLRQPGFNFWALITYQFIHASPLHVGGNMLFLWAFGPNVEDRFGKLGFLAFYLVGGAAAGGLHAIVSDAGVLGASGSVAAVTGAYLVLFPRTHIRTLLFFFVIGVFMIPAPWYIGAHIAYDFFMNARVDSGVAFAAHLGGYIFGFGVSFALLATGIIKHETYDLFGMARQARRRAAFRSALQDGEPWSHEGGSRVRADDKRRKRDEEKQARAVEARAAVLRALDEGDLVELALKHRVLLDEHGRVPLARDAQLRIANRLMEGERREDAAVAYQIFLDAYPTDREAPGVRLMLGLLCARHLNDPVRAKALLTQAKSELREEPQRRLAQELLDELG